MLFEKKQSIFLEKLKSNITKELKLAALAVGPFELTENRDSRYNSLNYSGTKFLNHQHI